MSDFKKLLDGIEKLMRSKRYFDANDKVRVYKISNGCQAVIFGESNNYSFDLDANLFI